MPRHNARKIGRFMLTEMKREEDCVVYEGYEESRPERPVRVKGYLRDRVLLENISVRIGIEENVLGRSVAYLRARYRELRKAETGSADPELESSMEGGGAISQTSTSSAVPISDADVPFEYYCSRHVLLIHDKMQSSSKVFLVRDLMVGSVHSILAHGRLLEEGALFYFYQLLMAVHFLHLHHVVHRNISTDHMYLARASTQVRLGGMSSCVLESRHNEFDAMQHASRSSTPQPGSYGICSNCHKDVPIVASAPDALEGKAASLLEHNGGDSGANVPPINLLFTVCRHCGVYQSRLKVLQTAVGTPGYLAPETLAYQPPSSLMSANTQSPASQAMEGKRITDGQARDIWACGVVLYHMLTASLPFDPLAQGGTVQPPSSTRTPEQVYDMVCRIVAMDYQIPAYVSETSRQLLQWILQRDPKQRPTALDLLRHPAFATVRDSVLRSV
ncbi:Protein kinase domain containing protein [Lotmaria passim]